ncbi:MAG: Tol-Pal system protein TolB, partial [Alphaproteobacteria bacterium]|nr:Tol-Pal system protein TolB [Alphaproteobacteria bacterium]
MKKFSLLSLLLLMFAMPVRAELMIDVNGAMRDPMPIAIAPMVGNNSSAENYGEQIREVVVADLERSGLFRIISEKSYIQKFKSIDEMPVFADWQAINSLALVQSAITETGANSLKIEFRLWDVFAEEQLKGQSFTTTKDNWRRVAHVIADAIYEQLTGEKGYFDTRIVYISESGPATRRIKRLAIMDQDGENHKFLTNGAAMA